jgi:serine/threonine protein kinase/Tol biopolymer transport system component
MPLTAGNRFGPYEIVGPLGAGGMGEVYRARDSRLNREVALKVLPPEFTGDPGRRARFEREAHAAAALNHPNIVGLYDVGEQDGVMYIVSEVVAGSTLAAMIARGPVPIRKLLDIAVQIADGIASAHAAGIVHRDLKPANIMITPEGRAKILDFGLARQTAKAAAADETATAGHTEPGMIVGTVNYMSPEQAHGKPADQRSDQFSFGLILYEMAAGKKAFDTPEPIVTMLAIVHNEAPPIERPIPAPLRWVIDRCLAKEPADRYESTRDLYQELRSLRDHASEASAAQAVEPASRRLGRWPLAAAAFGLGLLLMLAAWLFLAPPPAPDQSLYAFTPFSFNPGGQTGAVWSPDGKAAAYAASGDAGFDQVFVRRLDSDVSLQITHVPEGALPFAWMPDSHRILFSSSRQPAGIWSVAAVGGEPEPALSLDPSRSRGMSAWDVSPDGKAAAVLFRGDGGRWGVWTSTPLGSPLKKYSPDPFATSVMYNAPSLKFSPDGKSILLFQDAGVGRSREAWLMPYPANPARPPRRVLPNLPNYGGTPTFCWMPDSRHIALSLNPTPGGSRQIWEADVPSGKRYAILSGTTSAWLPAVSPDGRKMLFTEQVTNYDIVSAGIDGSVPKTLIATDRNELMPAWAAKQPVLAYVTDRNGPQEIWIRSGNADRPVVTPRDFPPGTTQWFMAPALSPEADRIVYVRIEASTPRLWISSVAGGTPIPLTNDTAAAFSGSWSPDGSWFAYGRINAGKSDLMKVKTTGQATPVVLKADTGVLGVPSWSPTGEWTAYGDELISPDGKTTRPLGKHGSQHYMFSADGKLVYGIRPDGDRNLLFSVDIATGAEKVIGDLGVDFRPGTSLNPGIRFSLAPDGKSFVYATGKTKNNLWLLEGFAPKTGLLARLGLR